MCVYIYRYIERDVCIYVYIYTHKYAMLKEYI